MNMVKNLTTYNPTETISIHKKILHNHSEGQYFQPNHLYTTYWSVVNFQPDHLYTTYRLVVDLYAHILVFYV